MPEQIRYEEEIMSLADSRSYVQTLVNFDNLASSQNFTSCEELLSQSVELSTNGSELHITDAQLIECCNKVEAATKEVKKVNNIDAPKRGDKTIMDLIFEDFSTTPFKSPISSPERSPLFILREKPKHFYSRKKSSDSILVAPDLDYNDIEKNDTHNENEGVVEIGISENYNWDEDDNDLFLSISTQEILDQNNFPSTSQFPVNKEIIQGRISNKSMESKFRNTANSSAQIANKTSFQSEKENFKAVYKKKTKVFQTANGKNVLISEKGKKLVEGLLNEFRRSESDAYYQTLKTSSKSDEASVSSLLAKKSSKEINPTSRDHSTFQKEESNNFRSPN
uniref:Uncharacterized protein n=1 Tax=Glossina pallidipes TaxID=7398 RepID=A0A1A9Z0R4_GLOPL